MLKLEVFDPPMCCATGICGNSVDPKLVTFASDLEWLKKQGIDVVRHGLSFEPAEFVKNEAVKNTLQADGNDCLPILVIDNEVVSKACYPERKKLAQICKVEYDDTQVASVQVEESFGCGPDCDCHKSDVSDNSKKIIFVTILLVIGLIIAFRFSCKAGAAETFYKNLTSTSQISPSEEVAFIYIPTLKNEKISNSVKNAMVSAKKALKAKNISVSLYAMSPKSSEYSQVASQTTPPAILTIYKGKNKNYVSGTINQTKLLQSYMTTTLAGGCGAECPCHKR
jgi:hypothetical protein